MAFVNTYEAGGGALEQTHPRNVVYQLDFTVNDPTNLGFDVDAANLLYGISSVTQTSDGGTAFALNAAFDVDVDDSTDAPDTYSNLTSLNNMPTASLSVALIVPLPSTKAPRAPAWEVSPA